MLPTDRTPTAPGEMLRAEFLEPLGLSPQALAQRSGLGLAAVEGVLAGRVPVDVAIAAGLERALQTSAQFWLNLQARVESWKQEHARGDRFEGGDE